SAGRACPRAAVTGRPQPELAAERLSLQRPGAPAAVGRILRQPACCSPHAAPRKAAPAPAQPSVAGIGGNASNRAVTPAIDLTPPHQDYRRPVAQRRAHL